MAFTRSFLKATGLTDEQISAVMEEHVAVTNGLKQERDNYKADADKLPDLQKKLQDAEANEDYKKKYESEHSAFEDFKTKTAEDAKAAEVRAAYRKLLVEEKIGENKLDKIIKVTDFSGMKLDKDGKLENESDLRKSIGEEWGEFRTTVSTKGAKVSTPPAGGGNKLTKEDILKIEDTAERQKAIAENLELFQKG